jgi:hypothetical protein
MAEWRNARDKNTGTATYGLSPRAVVTMWLAIDSSVTSNSWSRKARRKTSSDSPGSMPRRQPGTVTRPSNKGRLRSDTVQASVSVMSDKGNSRQAGRAL